MVGYLCTCCGERHEGLPFAYGAYAPAHWHEGLVDRPGCVLGGEQCVLDDKHFFVRARLVLPVRDSDEDFEWGVWVSLSEANFARAYKLWEDPERVNEPPYFGWLSTDLHLYEPTTVNLATHVHTQPVGVRPTVELGPTDHPLAVEQREGITVARVQEFAERLMHP